VMRLRHLLGFLGFASHHLLAFLGLRSPLVFAGVPLSEIFRTNLKLALVVSQALFAYLRFVVEPFVDECPVTRPLAS
jgi:hypothetical protein